MSARMLSTEERHQALFRHPDGPRSAVRAHCAKGIASTPRQGEKTENGLENEFSASFPGIMSTSLTHWPQSAGSVLQMVGSTLSTPRLPGASMASRLEAMESQAVNHQEQLKKNREQWEEVLSARRETEESYQREQAMVAIRQQEEVLEQERLAATLERSRLHPIEAESSQRPHLDALDEAIQKQEHKHRQGGLKFKLEAMHILASKNSEDLQHLRGFLDDTARAKRASQI